MARIKIEDLPEDQEISLKELRQVLGGHDLRAGSKVQLKFQPQQTRQRQAVKSFFGGTLRLGIPNTTDVITIAD